MTANFTDGKSFFVPIVLKILRLTNISVAKIDIIFLTSKSFGNYFASPIERPAAVKATRLDVRKELCQTIECVNIIYR